MTQKPRRIDLSPDNFIAGVAAKLSVEEVGLYWIICLLIYSQGGPVAYDESHWTALFKGTHWRTVKAASRRLQELGKITVRDGQVMAKGCAGPLQDAFKRIARASENGSKGGRPTNDVNGLNKPDGFLSENLARDAPPPSPPPPSPQPPPIGDLLSPPELPPLRVDSKQPPQRTRTQIGEYRPAQSQIDRAREFWASRNRQDLDVEDQIQGFRDHHLAHGSTMASWDAAWRTWVKNALQFTRKNQNGQANGSGHRKPTATDSHLAGIASLIDDIRSGGS